MHTNTHAAREKCLSPFVSECLCVTLSLYGAHCRASLWHTIFPKLSCIRMPKSCVSYRSAIRNSLHWAVCSMHNSFDVRWAFAWHVAFMHICNDTGDLHGISEFQIFVTKIAIFHRVPSFSGRKEIHSNWSHFLSIAACAATSAVAYAMR